MSAYLRDVTLKNLLITEDRLIRLNSLIEEIMINANAALAADSPDRLICLYMIRSDNRGYFFNNFQEVLGYFREARQVQRLAFALTTTANIPIVRSGGLEPTGKGMVIYLSQDDVSHNVGTKFEAQILPQASSLRVTDDDRAWTEGTFLRLHEQLKRFHSFGSLVVRTPLVPAAIQILIGILTFGIALVGALNLSRLFKGAQAGAVIFVLLLVLISPILALMQNPLVRLVNHYSPNIAFRDRKTHWLAQTIVGLVITAIVVTFAQIIYTMVLAAVQPYLITP